MKNVFISCTFTKHHPHEERPCEYIYSKSVLFRYSLAYARLLTDDPHIYILSAKHHVLRLKDKIRPYQVTLNNMSEDERKEWAEKVLQKMRKMKISFENETIFLTGENYQKYLIDKFANASNPLEGKGIGETESFLKSKTGKITESISLCDFLQLQLI